MYMFMIILMVSMMFFCFFLYFLIKDLVYFFEWEILNMNSCSIIMNFMFDWMSFLFMSFVLFISSMVVFYSNEYMKYDNNKVRFVFLVVLFILSMMFLIISPNLISILLGWDGLGLVSYCLVIYFQNFKSYNAGMLTALTNRIGDVALLLSIAWMFNLGSWSFSFYLFYSSEMSGFFMFMIIMAAMTKSAQIPFSSWLPAAMAAPTPVSALVHSSTLVTAGVYLLIRFSSFLLNCKSLLMVLMVLGSITMLMSGLGANLEMDFKKIIALSTLSQLGLMMGTLSLGFFKLSFFHLLTHALFKALLFLCAGIFIHSMMGFQDIRVSGGFNNQMVLTLMFFNISSLALSGMPFLAGFYSKDLILEMILMSNFNMMIFFFFFFCFLFVFFIFFYFIFFFFFSTGLTVMYSFRLISFCLKNYLGFSIICMGENSLMLFPMNFLMIMSVLGGSILMWLIFPYVNFIMLNIYFKLLVLFICMLGGFMGYFIFNSFKFYFKEIYLILNFFFSLMWFMPIIFSYFFNYFTLFLLKKYKVFLDYGWMEFYGGSFFKYLFYFLKLLLFKFSFLNYCFLLILLILFNIFF